MLVKSQGAFDRENDYEEDNHYEETDSGGSCRMHDCEYDDRMLSAGAGGDHSAVQGC